MVNPGSFGRSKKPDSAFLSFRIPYYTHWGQHLLVRFELTSFVLIVFTQVFVGGCFWWDESSEESDCGCCEDESPEDYAALIWHQLTFLSVPAAGTPITGKGVVILHSFQNKTFLVFVNIVVATTGLAIATPLWPTITEHLHHTRNVHHNSQIECLTVKTGVLGGGEFLSLDSYFFWLVALFLADNARSDCFEDMDNKVAVNL